VIEHKSPTTVPKTGYGISKCTKSYK